MDWIGAGLVFIVLVFVIQGWFRSEKRKQLPPGPKGLPVLGSLHLLGKFPPHDLHKLAQRYGSIMHMRFGLIPTVVISSPQAAELVLKTHDHVFASRPPSEAAKHISYGQKSLTFAPYGSYWRNMRKICTIEMLSNKKISCFKSMRKQELNLLVQKLKEASFRRTEVDVSANVSSLSANMTCRMAFSKKYSDEEFGEGGFKAVMQEDMRLIAVPNWGEYFPLLARLDFQGLMKQMKAVSKVYDVFLEKIIDEHMESKDQNQTKDFVDVMINFMGTKEVEYQIGRDHIKAILLDMLVGATDTSATAIEWALSELLKNPQIMKKVQKELEEKVGLDRMVEESDLEGLEYLDMVIKESFRLHPIVPLLIPHESVEDCTINGFLIPKKTRIIVNSHAIGRDPTAWNDADEFLPERFAGSKVDVYGQDFQLLPFGSGRRGCPGIQLGMTVVRLLVAQLVHCFDWELPDGMLPAELDMTAEFALVTPRAKPLIAVPTYRLKL